MTKINTKNTWIYQIKKKTIKLRYCFVLSIIKIFTPILYKKINIMSFTHDRLLNSAPNKVSKVPRPSIKFMKNKFKGQLVKGAEIGVQLGLNSKSILKELNIEKIYLVDIWENYNNYKIAFKKFKKNKKVRMIIDYSKYAVNYVEKESLDFVYIDANHKYNKVYQDIELWFQKVKKGGIIAGHDIFNCPDVLEAVKDFCIKKKIIYNINLPDWYFIKE